MANLESTGLMSGPWRVSDICEEFKHFKSSNKIDFTFSNVSYTVRKHMFSMRRKKILQNVNGEFRAGQLTAIMGPSGAGKSSLCNILAGYVTRNVTGELIINGKKRNLNSLRRLSSYIMQDDHVHTQLTVLESMNMAAELKLDASAKVRRLRVNFIMKLMGLDTVSKNFTQDLSGGQRKRLVIAFELLSDSPVMFFDEPTSHLDIVTSRQCVEIMKSLALGGRTIICTIHQPSATLLNMFDQLYVVAKGHCVYNGSVPNLLPFLDELGFRCPTYHNPSDFMMDVTSGEFGDHTMKLAEAAKNIYTQNNQVRKGGFDSNQSNRNKIKKRKRYACGFWKQFAVLLRTNIIRICRNRDLPMSIIMSHFLMAIFIGCLYWQIGQDALRMGENAKMIFFNMVFLSFCALSSTLQSFPDELPTLIREHFNSWYSVFSLYVAKETTHVIITTICTVGYTLITYFMTDQPIEIKRIGLTVLHCFLIGLISQTVGLFCAVALDPKISLFLGVYSLMPHLLFSGLYVRYRDTIPALANLFDYSIFKHGFEGIMLATYGYDRERLDCSDICEYTSPEVILKEYDMQNADYWYSTRYLVFFYHVVSLLAFLTVRWKLVR